MITKVYSEAITMRRPAYRGFKELAEKVQALVELEPEAQIEHPDFEAVLQACTVEDITPWLAEADYVEPAKLFDAIMEYCEFEAFFAERQRKHLTRLEATMRLRAAQLKAMKESGLLPDAFSMSDAVNLGESIQTTSQPSPPTMHVTSGGRANKSKPKTTGISSGTTPSPSADNKP